MVPGELGVGGQPCIGNQSYVSDIQEWLTPQPSRRPDIFPEFEKVRPYHWVRITCKTPLQSGVRG